jgi:hypothetical protein
VLVEDDPLWAGAAVALERPEAAVLVFGAARDETMAAIARAGVRVVDPSPATLAAALATMLATVEPRVILVPAPG